MIRILLCLLCSLSLSLSLSAQSGWGIEVRTDFHKTYNHSQLKSTSYPYYVAIVEEEADPNTKSFSLGLLKEINDRLTVKLHAGQHENGRVLTVSLVSDDLTVQEFQKADIPYVYFHLTPSVAYKLVNGRLSLPIELGLSFNKLSNRADIFYIDVHNYNYDVRCYMGLEYEIVSGLNFGAHLMATQALRPYSPKEVGGSFVPFQIGGAFSLSYRM